MKCLYGYRQKGTTLMRMEGCDVSLLMEKKGDYFDEDEDAGL